MDFEIRNVSPPLHGVTVVDFDTLLPGACVLSVLLEMGARVIRIKRGSPEAANQSGKAQHYFNLKDHVENFYIDLKSDEGREQALAVLSKADVLLEGFRPGKMKALGLGYSDVCQINMQIIYASLTGYGQTGPYACTAGHDINYMAAAGALALTARTEVPDSQNTPLSAPANASPIPFADVGGAMYAVSAILAALYQRQMTGMGQWLDIAMAEAIVHQMSPRLAAFQHKDIHGIVEQVRYLQKPAYGAFQCMDKKFISIAALETKFFTSLMHVLEIETFSDTSWLDPNKRQQHSHEINQEIQLQVARFTAEAVATLLHEKDVPAMIVLEPDEIANQTSFQDRNLFVQTEGGGLLPRFPVRMRGMSS